MRVRFLPPLPLLAVKIVWGECYFASAHLPCRSFAVTIGTTYIALGDLGIDLGPRAVAHQVRHRRALGGPIAVVEFQDDRIALAAVDARMQP